jgi:RimJ/RimL family protein N-acetyltransferase
MMTSREVTPKDYPTIWHWMKDELDLHCDDSGPSNIVEFYEFMEHSALALERCIMFEEDGHSAGAIKFDRAGRLVSLRGMVFAPHVRGTGFAQSAVSALLNLLHEDGVRKVSFTIFANNFRAQRFFFGLGAVVEGILVKHVVQGGEPKDMMVLALHA